MTLRHHALALALCLGLGGGCSGGATLPRPAPPGVAAHPITGARLPRLVSEADELGAAARQHAAITEAGGRGGPRFLNGDDPEVARARRVFADLVAVAHRSELPWQLHVLGSPEPRSFGTGAGYIYLSTGLLGERGLLAEPDDDALAAALAHELAHTALLHTRVRDAWQLAALRARSNPYHGMSYTPSQELEADRLAALYQALAGYDPRAGARLWQSASQRYARNPGIWLDEHPLRGQRLRQIAEAAELASAYYTPGRQPANWQAIRARSPLFPDAPAAAAGEPSGPGEVAAGAPVRAARPPTGQEPPTRTRGAAAGGAADALNAALDAQLSGTPLPASGAARRPIPPSPLLGLLHFVRVQTGTEPGVGRSVQIYLHNGAERELVAVGLRVIYLAGGREVASDPDCGGPAHIPAGAAGWILCDFKSVPGATEYEVQLSGAQFQ